MVKVKEDGLKSLKFILDFIRILSDYLIDWFIQLVILEILFIVKFFILLIYLIRIKFFFFIREFNIFNSFCVSLILRILRAFLTSTSTSLSSLPSLTSFTSCRYIFFFFSCFCLFLFINSSSDWFHLNFSNSLYYSFRSFYTLHFFQFRFSENTFFFFLYFIRSLRVHDFLNNWRSSLKLF